MTINEINQTINKSHAEHKVWAEAHGYNMDHWMHNTPTNLTVEKLLAAAQKAKKCDSASIDITSDLSGETIKANEKLGKIVIDNAIVRASWSEILTFRKGLRKGEIVFTHWVK